MIQEFNNHKRAYIVLSSVLIGFVVLFLHLWPDRTQQKIALVALGVFYFLWGVVVHAQIGKINSKIVLEYLAVSILAVCLVLLLLW